MAPLQRVTGDARLERPSIFPRRRPRRQHAGRRPGAAGQPDDRRPPDRRARGGARLHAVREAPGRLCADPRRQELLARAEEVEAAALKFDERPRQQSPASQRHRRHHHRGSLRHHLARAAAARASRAASRDPHRARHRPDHPRPRRRRGRHRAAQHQPTAARRAGRPAALHRRLDALLQPRLCRAARRPEDASRT